MATHFIVEYRIAGAFFTAAVHEDKDEAIRLAQEAYPEEQLFWTKIVDGEEAGGGLVGILPANFGM